MLSGETSVGAFPIQSVRTVARIIENTEENGGDRIAKLSSYDSDQSGVICQAAASLARVLDARYLVTFTLSGATARQMSRLRSPIPQIAFSPLEETRRQLALSWGVECYKLPNIYHTDEMVDQVDLVAKAARIAEPGEKLVIVAGMPPGIHANSNSIRVHTISGTTPDLGRVTEFKM